MDNEFPGDDDLQLSVREEVALEFMAAAISKGTAYHYSPKEYAAMAFEYADAFLAKRDEVQGD